MNNRRFFKFGTLMMLVFNINVLAQGTFTDPAYPPEKEIYELLRVNDLSLEKEVAASLIFKLSEEMKIEIVKIKTQNEEVKDFILSQLNGHKLTDEGWHTNKLYELPINVRP